MSSILAYLKKHPTKITGFLLVVAGALQANTTVLQGVLTQTQFAWFTVVVGCVVAGLGFINGSKPSQP